MKTKTWTKAKDFEGLPNLTDFKLVEEQLPEVKNGEILIEALYLSVDPYMRIFPSPVGSPMIGEQVAKVLESKCSKFPVGSLVLAQVGWRERTVVEPTSIGVIPAWNTGRFPSSYTLGAIGMPGLTAYAGLLKICDPKPGETLFVNSSAGIVGCVVGQIGKIKGCRVIGSAGTDEKCRLLEKEYGFDKVFNYKTAKLSETLKEAAPKGIDCYFDNVGGDMSCEVIQHHMNPRGRMAICGSLSGYNATTPQVGPLVFMSILGKELKVQGLMVYSYENIFNDATSQLLKWIEEGKLKCQEKVLNGFEKMPEAFIGLLRGSYSGKVVVKGSGDCGDA